jgi:hypothetical protein
LKQQDPCWSVYLSDLQPCTFSRIEVYLGRFVVCIRSVAACDEVQAVGVIEY